MATSFLEYDLVATSFLELHVGWVKANDDHNGKLKKQIFIELHGYFEVFTYVIMNFDFHKNIKYKKWIKNLEYVIFIY